MEGWLPKGAPGKKRSPRVEAFTRLSELFANRNREEGDETDLSLAMQGEPKITPSLKMAHGGLGTVLTALRAFDDPDAQQFMELHDSLTATDRSKLSLEEIAVAADIGASRLLGVATEALSAYGASVSQIILGASLPAIVRKSVTLAKTTRGILDREMMLKAGAVLPIPKGSQVAINQQVINQASEVEPKSLKPWDQESRLREIQAAWGESKGSLPPKPPHEPLSPALDKLQDRATGALEDV